MMDHFCSIWKLPASAALVYKLPSINLHSKTVNEVSSKTHWKKLIFPFFTLQKRTWDVYFKGWGGIEKEISCYIISYHIIYLAIQICQDKKSSTKYHNCLNLFQFSSKWNNSNVLSTMQEMFSFCFFLSPTPSISSSKRQTFLPNELISSHTQVSPTRYSKKLFVT